MSGLAYVPKSLETEVYDLSLARKVRFIDIVNSALMLGLAKVKQSGADRALIGYQEEYPQGSIYVMPQLADRIKAETDSIDNLERYQRIVVIALRLGLEEVGEGELVGATVAAPPPDPAPRCPARPKPERRLPRPSPAPQIARAPIVGRMPPAPSLISAGPAQAALAVARTKPVMAAISPCSGLMHQYQCRVCGPFEISHARFLTLGGEKPKCPTCVAA